MHFTENTFFCENSSFSLSGSHIDDNFNQVHLFGFAILFSILFTFPKNSTLPPISNLFSYLINIEQKGFNNENLDKITQMGG